MGELNQMNSLKNVLSCGETDERMQEKSLLGRGILFPENESVKLTLNVFHWS